VHLRKNHRLRRLLWSCSRRIQKKNSILQNSTCSIKCGADKHSACDCKMTPPRTYISDDLVQFRQDILDKHNELRNKFASGEEPKTAGKKASNMMVLNYDLELEHIAKCHGGHIVSDHDQCRLAHDKTPVGQNLAGSSSNTPNYHMQGMQNW
jgi:hypothetical protein